MVRIEQTSEGTTFTADGVDITASVIRATVHIEIDPADSVAILTMPLDQLSLTSYRCFTDAPTGAALRLLGWMRSTDGRR